MKYRKKKDIIDFFDVSIIMPFYKRLEAFKLALPKNASFFQRNGVEIILLLDDPKEEKELLKFVELYPFINFKIIINRKKHEWRNPCKVLNVGIRHASFKYVLVLDPEVELITDVVYQLRYIISYHPNTFATGVVAFIDEKDNINELKDINWMPYGSIMVAKHDLINIRGYDESFKKWGGEDDQIRRKLNLYGLKKMELVDAKTIHRDKDSDGHKERSSRIDKMPIRHLKYIFHPKNPIYNENDWGLDFKESIWDWKTHKSYNQLTKYAEAFQDFRIADKSICENKYEIMALIQIRNESKNVSEILNHLKAYCDGIILLDDGSTDDSYEKASHEKLFLKIKKEYKGYFDDLENRNILLRTASFFKSKWFFFIDADERFDPRYDDIRSYTNIKGVDIFRFNLVDLWDNPETYRVDIPDKRKDGICTRARMFRNKGNLQIYANREIHFPAVPYQKNVKLANELLLLHYGNFDKETRKRKYELYTVQDSEGKKQAHSYDFLMDDKVLLKEIKGIVLEN